MIRKTLGNGELVRLQQEIQQPYGESAQAERGRAALARLIDEYKRLRLEATEALTAEAREVIDSAAFVSWQYHDVHGWFCPFGCHIRLRDKRELLYREAPPHDEQCAVTLAHRIRERRKSAPEQDDSHTNG